MPATCREPGFDSVMPSWTGVAGLTVAIAMFAVTASAQAPRVDPSAREILGHRLTLDNLRHVEAVMRAMDGVPSRGLEAPRADVAFITVLQMGWAYHQPWRDAMVGEHAHDIVRGHADLAGAIRGAGISTRDYVLTVMNLLLACPVSAQRRQGRTVTATDVAPENVQWVGANWRDVERLMHQLGQRMAAARR